MIFFFKACDERDGVDHNFGCREELLDGKNIFEAVSEAIEKLELKATG